MMICTVCGRTNDDLATVCLHCHSFLQGKVDSLDLFATAWGLLERTGQTFRRIVMSRHKNYVIPLSMVVGAGIGLTAAQVTRAGSGGAPVVGILGTVIAGGMAAGLLLCWATAVISAVTGRLVRGRGSLTNLRAVFAYACLPYVAGVCIIHPIRFAIFGKYLFDPNPAPWVIDPVSYYTLLTLEGVAIALTAGWYLVGTSIAHGISRPRALIPAGAVLAFVVAGFIALGV